MSQTWVTPYTQAEKRNIKLIIIMGYMFRQAIVSSACKYVQRET